MESLALSYFSGIHAFAVDTYRYLKVNQDENITNYQANRQRRYNKKMGEMGFVGLPFPKEYALDFLNFITVVF